MNPKLNGARRSLTYWHAQLEMEWGWLAERAGAHKVIVEIGACTGCSTHALADNTQGVLYSVDNWTGGTDQTLIVGVLRTYGSWEACFQAYLKNTADLKNLVLVKQASLTAARLLAHVKFDMIFIDASHDYQSVLDDIRAWRPLLAEGGLLCGHDYSACFPGVMRAVQEAVPGFKIGCDTIWTA